MFFLLAISLCRDSPVHAGPIHDNAVECVSERCLFVCVMSAVQHRRMRLGRGGGGGDGCAG